jgi:exodeoxyribonuclease V alpha subunit
MQIEGIVKKVIFHNNENGFIVFTLSQNENIHKITGFSNAIYEGDFLCINGEHSQFNGESQYKIKTFTKTEPTELSDIVAYLSSKRFKGIGKKTAANIVDKLKEKTIETIKKNPENLKGIKGVTRKIISHLQVKIIEEKKYNDLENYLSKFNINNYWIIKIFEKYGLETLSLIKENPYKLIYDFSKNIEFSTLDNIAKDLDISLFDYKRTEAGIYYVIHQNTELTSDVAMPYTAVIKGNSKLLNISEELSEESIITSLHKELIKEDNINDETHLYLKSIYYAEVHIAEKVNKILNNKKNIIKNVESAIENIEKREKINLSMSQKKAMLNSLNSNISVITGKPGTGKTTIINCLIKVFKQKLYIDEKDIVLCSPTGRAAKKMSESTNMSASTIHRLLKPNVSGEGFVHDERKLLKGKLFIIDEMSMVDLLLAYYLLRAIPDDAIVVFVGDVNQLESIGCGEVLSDFIESKIIPVSRLIEIHRQAEKSFIIKSAHSISEGENINFHHDHKDNDVWFVQANSYNFDSQLISVFNRIKDKYNLDPFSEIQTITAKYNGAFGQNAINNVLQNNINDSPNFIEVFFNNEKYIYKENDKVIQTTNNIDKDIYNGDIGYIESITDREVYINFYGDTLIYKKNELDQIKLAYAITVHKSQGSEFPCVIIPIDFEQGRMLRRNLIYTALTRGKQMVVFLGNKAAIEKAIKTLKEQRLTTLKERLQEKHV